MTGTEAPLQAITQRLRAEFEGGFPLMMPVPSTEVFKLIDHASALSARDRDSLIAEIAAGTLRILQGGAAGVIGSGGAYDRFYSLKMGPGPLTGGARYTPVRALADRRFPAPPGAPTPPRVDLLPGAAALVPATARTLKPRVTAVMQAAGYALQKVPGGAARFLSPAGTVVDVEFGGRIDQLRLGVAIDAADVAAAPQAMGPRYLSPGVLFGFYNDAWDYLTEENADRCLGHLPTLIAATEDMLRLGR